MIVRVDHEHRGAVRVVGRDRVEPIFPRDHVGAVAARERDDRRRALVVVERVELSVDARQRETGSLL